MKSLYEPEELSLSVWVFDTAFGLSKKDHLDQVFFLRKQWRFINIFNEL